MSIDSIIAESRLELPLKSALRAAFAELVERQGKIYDALEERIEGQVQDRKIGQIVTGLAAESELQSLESYGLREIVPIDAAIGRQRAFLKTGYSECRKLQQREFMGESDAGAFRFRLVPDPGFVMKESILRKLWPLYRLNQPAPFAPWLRHAVYVEGAPQGSNLRLKENGLEGILLTDMLPIWNVSFETGSGGYSETKTPGDFGETYNYHYTAKDGDRKLWHLPQDVVDGKIAPEMLDAEIGEETVKLACAKPLADRGWQRINVDENTAGSLKEYSKIFEQKGPGFFSSGEFQQRSVPLQSRGQIDLFLSMFKIPGFSACLAQAGEGDSVVTRWQRDLAGRDRGINLSTSPMTVRFKVEGQGDPIFLEDYANWVLEELELRLPLFAWRGVFRSDL